MKNLLLEIETSAAQFTDPDDNLWGDNYHT